MKYRRKASAPAAALARASAGTGKSVGPTTGRDSVVSAALVDGSVVLASTFSEQPVRTAVARSSAKADARIEPGPGRSRTAGGYAGPSVVRSVTVDRSDPTAGTGERCRPVVPSPDSLTAEGCRRPEGRSGTSRPPGGEA